MEMSSVTATTILSLEQAGKEDKVEWLPLQSGLGPGLPYQGERGSLL